MLISRELSEWFKESVGTLNLTTAWSGRRRRMYSGLQLKSLGSARSNRALSALFDHQVSSRFPGDRHLADGQVGSHGGSA